MPHGVAVIAARSGQLAEAVERADIVTFDIEDLPVGGRGLGELFLLMQLVGATKHDRYASGIETAAEIAPIAGGHIDAFDDAVFRAERILVRFVAAQEIIGREAVVDGVTNAV